MTVNSLSQIAPIPPFAGVKTSNNSKIQPTPLQRLQEPFQGPVEEVEWIFFKSIIASRYEMDGNGGSRFVFQFPKSIKTVMVPKFWFKLFDQISISPNEMAFTQKCLDFEKLKIFRERWAKVERCPKFNSCWSNPTWY